LSEIDEIGILEFLQKKGIIVIEWGEKVREIIKPDIAIIIKKTGKNKRELTFEYSEKFKRVFYENFINK
jgi:tRNA A37 threonylcarbamoyladenosine biosynthesis protein TsaE